MRLIEFNIAPSVSEENVRRVSIDPKSITSIVERYDGNTVIQADGMSSAVRGSYDEVMDTLRRFEFRDCTEVDLTTPEGVEKWSKTVPMARKMDELTGRYYVSDLINDALKISREAVVSRATDN